MPQAIPAIQAGIAAIAKWYASLSAVGQFAVATIATTAASYVLGRVLSPKAPGITEGNTLELRVDPLAPGRVVYGYQRVSGDLRFKHVGGTDNEYLYLIIVWAYHPCEGIFNLRLDDEIVPLDGSGNATGDYAGFLRCTHHLGATDQTADANFVSEINSKWTSAHPLRGRTYSAIRLKYDTSKFPGGLPLITVELKGKNDIYDPVADTTGWSDNAALCIRDYLLDQNIGLQGTTDDLDEAGWVAEINTCDEDVTLADEVSTEKRYTINLAFDTSAEPKQIIETMLTACAGKLYDIGGVAKLRVGSWVAPDFDVDESMLRGGIASTSPLSVREKLNRVRATFTDPAELWNRNEAPPVDSSTYITADGGRELAAELDLVAVNSAARAQRVQKIALLRSRQGIIAAIPGNLRIVPLLPGETFRLTNTKRGWTNKHFECEAWSLSIETGDDGGLGFACDAVGHETASTVYDWGFDEESDHDPAPNTDLPDPRVVPAPAGLTLATGGSHTVVQEDGTIVPRLHVSWTLPSDIFVSSGGLTRIQYGVASSAIWFEWGTVTGVQSFDYILGLVAGSDWDVRIRHENRWAVGDWSAAESITVLGDTTAPATPTSLTATAKERMIALSWSNSAAADRDETLIYRHTSNNFAGATLVGQVKGNRFDDLLVTPGTTYYYWVVSEDRSNNTSAASTVASATAVDDLSTALANASAAIVDAATAQGTADGKVTTFYQASAPTPEGVGDLWIDTDDGNLLRRWDGVAWVAVQDTDIAAAIADAATAQSTADGKIVTYYQASPPTAEGIGDLWTDTDDGDRLYRWNGSAWVDVQGISTDVPATPSAPTFSSEGTDTAGDGTVMSYITINLPALPTGAAGIQVLYRATGATGWIVGDQRDTGGGTTRIDDLTPGKAYQFAVQAYSPYSILSAISSALSRTAPNKTGGPTAPSGTSISADGVRPKFLSATTVFLFGTRVGWAPCTDADYAYTEVKGTFTNSDGAVDYTWTPYDGNSVVRTTGTQCWLYTTGLTAGYVRIRHINRSGVASGWTLVGNANSAASIGTGTLAAQSTTAVEITGLEVGNGSSVQKALARYEISEVKSLTGGSPTETISFSLTNRGFGTKPDVGHIQCASSSNIICVYDYDNGSNSSSIAYVNIRTADGTNLPSGFQRFSVSFVEYD